jgi:hypothetical protein
VTAPNRSPNDSELQNSIAAIAKVPESNVVIALDALDECPDSKALVACIKGAQEGSGRKIRIILTSQPLPDIEDLESTELNLQGSLQKSVNVDIEILVETKIKNSTLLSQSSKLIESKLLDAKDRFTILIFLSRHNHVHFICMPPMFCTPFQRRSIHLKDAFLNENTIN